MFCGCCGCMLNGINNTRAVGSFVVYIYNGRIQGTYVGAVVATQTFAPSHRAQVLI